MAVKRETITKHSYSTVMGNVELIQEENCAQVTVPGMRTTKPENLRELAQMLNDVATLMEMKDL